MGPVGTAFYGHELEPPKDAFRKAEFIALLRLPIRPVAAYRGSVAYAMVNPGVRAATWRTGVMSDKVRAREGWSE